jgi:BirA family biotin operon repressor/biotin-[acetyl-CoA-carboxylase] ligase
MSVVAPRVDPAARALLPLRVGVAVCRAVERAAPGVRAGLKWPNDVQLGGRKVAGVLCESTPAAVVIGIGVNVRPGALSPEVGATAVALDEAAGVRVDRAGLAGALLSELRELLDGGAPTLAGALAREVDARDVLKDRPVTIASGESGVARGIEHDGALRLETIGGAVRRVVAGGVRVREG